YFPFRYYPCAQFKAETLFPVIRANVLVLESLTVCNGAKPNRKLYHIHRHPDLPKDAIIHKTPNPYADDKWDLFVFDVPYLVVGRTGEQIKRDCHMHHLDCTHWLHHFFKCISPNLDESFISDIMTRVVLIYERSLTLKQY
ncbi:unnamed protein product, partial [Owenia fusiformis]